MSFTPGPREVGVTEFMGENEIVHIRSAFRDVNYEDGSGQFKSHIGTADGMDYANLIAAAPEMLELLEKTLKLIERDSTGGQTYDSFAVASGVAYEIENIINKARGLK